MTDDEDTINVRNALDADECVFHKDVDGVHSIDPRIGPEARRLMTMEIGDSTVGMTGPPG